MLGSIPKTRKLGLPVIQVDVKNHFLMLKTCFMMLKHRFNLQNMSYDVKNHFQGGFNPQNLKQQSCPSLGLKGKV